MNDSTFYKFIDDIDSLVNKIHFTHEKFSLTQTDRLKELIDLSQNLLDKLEAFQYCYENDNSKEKRPPMIPYGFEWTDKNTKDNNWGRKDE